MHKTFMHPLPEKFYNCLKRAGPEKVNPKTIPSEGITFDIELSIDLMYLNKKDKSYMWSIQI